MQVDEKLSDVRLVGYARPTVLTHSRRGLVSGKVLDVAWSIGSNGA